MTDEEFPGLEPELDGGAGSSAGIAPAGPDDLREFLEAYDDATGYEVRWRRDGDGDSRDVVDVSLIERSVQRPSAVSMVRCLPVDGEPFKVRVDSIHRLHTTELDFEDDLGDATDLATATWLRRRAASEPQRVDVPALVDLCGRADQPALKETLRAIQRLASERPGDCAAVVPVLVDLLEDDGFDAPARVLVALSSIAEADAAAIAPHVDVIGSYCHDGSEMARAHAAGCVKAVSIDDPEAVLDAVPAVATMLADRASGIAQAAYALDRVSREYPETVAPCTDSLREVILDESLDSSTRISATGALGRVYHEQPDMGVEFVDDVVELFDADAYKLRNNAIALVSEVALRNTQVLEPHVDDLVALLAIDDDYTRTNASATLARIAEDFPDEMAAYLDEFIALLEDDHHLVRVNACWALGHLGERATAALSKLEVRRYDDEEEVSTRAQWAIARIEPTYFG